MCAKFPLFEVNLQILQDLVMFPIPFNRDFSQLQLSCAAWLGFQGAANGSVGGLEIQNNKEIITQCEWFQAVSNPNRTFFWLAGISGSKESWVSFHFS